MPIGKWETLEFTARYGSINRSPTIFYFSIVSSSHVLPNKRLRLRKVNAPNNGYTFPSSTIRFGITLKYCNISIISNSEIFHPKVYEKIVYIPIEHRSFQRKYGGVSYIVKSNTIRIKSVSQLATNIYKLISSKEKFGKRQEKNRTRMWKCFGRKIKTIRGNEINEATIREKSWNAR